MANFLAALLQGLSGQQPPTTVDEITVMPPKRPPVVPPSPAQNPYTDDYIAAAQAAAQAQGKLPRVSGGTDAGLYGFLPQGVRNGRFRDILGAIGDGLLIGSKADPIYAPRKAAREMGQAMIGYDQNPQAALMRLMQTGAPDSIETAKGLLTGLQTSEDKAASRELTAGYHKELTRARTDGILQRAAAIVPGVLARVTTPEGYASAYARLDAVAKRIDPDADPTTAWGLPAPEDWTPEMTAWIGTTGGQQIGADVRREGIAQRERANIRTTGQSDVNNRRSTSTSSANNQRTVAQSDINSRRAAENKAKNGGGLHERNKPTTSGGKPTVLNRDVTLLKSNPTAANRAAFDKHFGPGSAKRYLGN